MQSSQQGLNRIELLIVVAAIAGLAAVAIPAYQTYKLKAKFAQVVNALGPYKASVEQCAKDASCVVGGKLSGLGLGKFGMPPSFSTTYMASVAVADNGTITATANKVEGLAGETYVLIPSYGAGSAISWAGSGTCKTRSGGAIC